MWSCIAGTHRGVSSLLSFERCLVKHLGNQWSKLCDGWNNSYPSNAQRECKHCCEIVAFIGDCSNPFISKRKECVSLAYLSSFLCTGLHSNIQFWCYIKILLLAVVVVVVCQCGNEDQSQLFSVGLIMLIMIMWIILNELKQILGV